MSCELVSDSVTVQVKRKGEKKQDSSNLLNSNEIDENERNQIETFLNRSSDNHRLSNSGDHNIDNGMPRDLDDLKYGAKHVIKIFIPVSICMLIVVISILSLPYYQKTNVYMVYTPFTDQQVDNSTKIWQSFANALILITVIAIMSFVLILLYTRRYYKILNGWLIISSLSLLFMITSAHVYEVLKVLNMPIDTLTIMLLIWNFGAIGMVAIHWKGPMIVRQSYLLFVSSLMALSFIKYIPDWTVWPVLGAVSIWDLIAVLCPKGPLRILVETAEERQEQLFPSLVYSSGMAYMVNVADENRDAKNGEENELDESTHNFRTGGTGTETNSNQNVITNRQSRQSTIQQTRLVSDGENTNTQTIHDTSHFSIDNGPNSSSTPFVLNTSDSSLDSQGVKLGLGDFVFYSILVGKVSTYGDWNTTLACFVAILIGLCMTLLLLAILKTALPALPISITFGLIFFFSTSFVVQPFLNELANRQIFI